MAILDRLTQGLSRTRGQIGTILGRSSALNEGFYEALEESLISADVGVEQTDDIMERLRKIVRDTGIRTPEEAFLTMKRMLSDDLTIRRIPAEFPPRPWIVLVVGVNGVGKTTTIAKLAREFIQKGKQVMMGAADTFRAGAIEQLRVWAERTGSAFVSQHEGADAASVAFDTVEAAKARHIDVVMLDTAGRLHNKANLMNELEKIVRVVKRNTPHAPNEVLLVLDATTGQNAVRQTKVFHERLGVTGLIITKLDGTAKGGIALALASRFGLPIRKIGVGEGMDDLQDFDAEAYVEAMFGEFDSE